MLILNCGSNAWKNIASTVSLHIVLSFGRTVTEKVVLFFFSRKNGLTDVIQVLNLTAYNWGNLYPINNYEYEGVPCTFGNRTLIKASPYPHI